MFAFNYSDFSYGATSIGNKFKKALKEISRKNYFQALEILHEIDSMNPFIAEVKNNMGYVYEKLNKPLKAEELYIHALKIKGNYPEALNNLGFFLTVHKKDYEQAEKYLKKAVKLNPRSKYFRDSLGYLYLEKKELNKAREQFEKALLLDPGFMSARQNLTAILFTLGNYKKCITAIAGLEENFETLFLKYRCYKKISKYQEAHLIFRKLKTLYETADGDSSPSAPLFKGELKAFIGLSMAEALRVIEGVKTENQKKNIDEIAFEDILKRSPVTWKSYLEEYSGDFFYSPLEMYASAEYGINVNLFEKKERALELIDTTEIELQETRKILKSVNSKIEILKQQGYIK